MKDENKLKVIEFLGEPTYKESKTNKNKRQNGRTKAETTIETWFYKSNNGSYCVDISYGVAGDIKILG